MTKPYAVDQQARAARRGTKRVVTRRNSLKYGDERQEAVVTVERSVEHSELAVVVAAMSRAFKSVIDFHKADYGGGLSHADAVGAAEEMRGARRAAAAEEMPVDEISWGVLS